jgi:peptidoglycan hydrolase-like protein with peptidoglycan-binding domain
LAHERRIDSARPLWHDPSMAVTLRPGSPTLSSTSAPGEVAGPAEERQPAPADGDASGGRAPMLPLARRAPETAPGSKGIRSGWSPTLATTIEASPEPMVRGTVGPSIAQLQAGLAHLGFEISAGELGGHYGRDTHAAVREFQTRQGMPSTGSADLDTRKALLSAVGGGPAAIVPSFLQEVKQKAAIALGYVEIAAGDVGIDHVYPVTAYQFKMSDALTRGSRIDSMDGYLALKNQGYQAIVDLREEGRGDEGFGAKEAGLETLRIPVIDNTAPTMAQVKEFLDFVSRPENEPVYFHCEAGKGRTGVFAACARMALEGWSVQDALAEAEKFGDSLVDQQNFIIQFGRALAANQVQGYPLAR